MYLVDDPAECTGNSRLISWNAVGPEGPPGVPGDDGEDGADGEDGDSAYDIWLAAGNVGTEADFLAWLQGQDGADGDSAYDIWLAAGNVGTEADFLASLQGQDGEDGAFGGSFDDLAGTACNIGADEEGVIVINYGEYPDSSVSIECEAVANFYRVRVLADGYYAGNIFTGFESAEGTVQIYRVAASGSVQLLDRIEVVDGDEVETQVFLPEGASLQLQVRPSLTDDTGNVGYIAQDSLGFCDGQISSTVSGNQSCTFQVGPPMSTLNPYTVRVWFPNSNL